MEDTTIVQLYWDRDPDAIVHTADKYGAYCRAIAVNILGSHEDAEECVNDTYMSAWQAIPPHRPSVDNVERTLEYEQLVQAIDTFLDSLTVEKRGVFVRRYWYTDSVADIAKRIGKKEKTVSKMLSRIRAQLCLYLEERGYEIG